ncbi:MAG: hypothetical protein U0M60_01615, partial [Clostridia bacterium]|nr:hypothetical protein [Clostridia bacterium]
MKKQMNKFVSLTLAIAMLLSLTVMPQISANETEATEEILVWSDFEYDKGGFMGQYDNGAATGGVDRVYTDAAHGNSYRIYARAVSETSKRTQQRAFLNLPEAVSTGKLLISYEIMSDDVRLKSYISAGPESRDEVLTTDNYKMTTYGQDAKNISYITNHDYKYGNTYEVIENNKWYQVDMVIDFDSKDRPVTYYVNGEVLGEAPLHPGSTKTDGTEVPMLGAIGHLTFAMWSINGTDGGSLKQNSLYIDNLK